MKRCICVVLLLAACGTAPTSDNATDTESVALPYSSPEEAGIAFETMYTALDDEYNMLHARRTTAYAHREGSLRDSLLRISDEECAAFEERLSEADSLWHATARHYYDLGDGSFTRLCDSRDLDSVQEARRMRAFF